MKLRCIAYIAITIHYICMFSDLVTCLRSSENAVQFESFKNTLWFEESDSLITVQGIFHVASRKKPS
jgi:hypothetical protein